jgi:hypothetical protein
VALAGYSAAIVLLVRRHKSERGHRDVVATILSLGLITILLYPLHPFSGYGPRATLEMSGRPLFAFYFVGVMLFGLVVAPFVRGLGLISKRLTISLLWFAVVIVSLANILSTLVYIFISGSLVIMVSWVLVRRSDPERVRTMVQE